MLVIVISLLLRLELASVPSTTTRMTRNQQLIYKEAPTGLPEPGKHTKVESKEINLETVKLDGGILVKNLFLSLDPYQRGRMRDPSIPSYSPPFDLNKPLTNFAVGEILRSEATDYKKGEHIYYMGQFEEYSVVKEFKALGVMKLDQIKEKYPSIEWQSFIGSCGMPGKTASYGFEVIGQPKKGETIFISSAAGAVGSLVGQLAKEKGLYVIGSAGSDEKVKFLQELGFDHAFNYKSVKTDEELKKLDRKIDINWENVGAHNLDSLLPHMNKGGRIVVCGLAATYNGEDYGYKNISFILKQRLRVEGFIILDHPDWNEEFYKTIPKLVGSGKFKIKEDVTEGLENAEKAFVNLLTGKNTGKAIIKL